MSDEARTVLIVTDDPGCSGQISEQLLRAGVHTIRFAPTQEARKLTHAFMPDLVLIHMTRSASDAGQGMQARHVMRCCNPMRHWPASPCCCMPRQP
jgi:DNA-binding NtrC family response regulator